MHSHFDQVRVHTFGTTREAYDASQTRDSIRDGDVLHVPSEAVTGFLMAAWPIAVTPERGEFHRHELLDAGQPVTYRGKDYARSVERAQQVAAQMSAYVESEAQAHEAQARECSASYATGGADPYATSCEEPAGHYPATPHRGADPMGGAGYVEWRGGGSVAGDALPYRDVRWLDGEAHS